MKTFKLSPQQKYWIDFLFSLTEKEIKARYKHAFLGFLWIALNPVLQMFIIGFVFQFFVPVKVDNYFIFLFTGLLPWNFFSYSISKTTTSIVYERSLIKKAKFPREAIPLSIVLSHFFHFIISFLILLAVLMIGVFIKNFSIFDTLMYFARAWLIVPFLALIIWLTSGLSLFFSALNVRFRDINFMVKAIVPLWFYATPIVYSLDLLPESLHSLFYLNPMTAIIEGFRWILMDIPPLNVNMFPISLVAIILIGIAGWVFFQSKSGNFDDWI